MTDVDFGDRLESDPASALASYPLTASERRVIESGDEEEILRVTRRPRPSNYAVITHTASE